MQNAQGIKAILAAAFLAVLAGGLFVVFARKSARSEAGIARLEGKRAPTRAELAEAADRFFNAPVVRWFDIELKEPQENALRQDARTYVRANVTIDGRRIENVGVHLKGRGGSFRRLDEKPGFHIKFDHFTPDLRFEGFKGLLLNNSRQDKTFFREIVARGVYRDAGLPTPRVSHARVKLNGKYQGLYVLMEVLNKDFLAQYFERTDGNLYKPYVRDISMPLPQESGKDWSGADVKKLLAACEVEDAQARWRELHKVLDVEQFIRFVAVEMLVAHGDGYVLNRNNYFLYNDPKTGRFNIFTHDLDGAFKNPQLGLVPGWRSIITRAVLQCPQGRWEYRRCVDRLFTEFFTMERLEGRLNEAARRLLSSTTNSAELAEYRQNIEELRRQITERHQYLADLLGRATQQLLPTPGKPDAPLRWTSRAKTGTPRLESSAATLSIGITNSPASGGWAADVFLPPGRYRFEGRVQLVGVGGGAESNTGSAWLGAAGRSSAHVKSATGDTLLGVDFDVSEGDKALELFCGFEGKAGEAQFSRKSLRVVKLP